MRLPIQKFREIVFHLLYSSDFGSLTQEIFPFLMEHHKVTKKSVYEALDVVAKIKKQLPEIDQFIKTSCKEYAFERILRVEKNLLRLAIYEMLHPEEVSPKVAISEALRLARKFATVESAHFVNGVLDTFYKNSG